MKVSVIIPCYNGEDYIGQTLGSLFDQTRPADEIIVVDDGSEDQSVDIARSFGASVTVLTKENGGAAKARNCGADHSTGDALMFLDADDVLAPDVLEHLIAQLEFNPKGVVACPWYRLDKVGDKWVKRPPSCVPLRDNQDYLSGWITGWYHLPCSILWSRTAYEKTGGWDPRAYVNDDGDLMMRALSSGVELQITDEGASFYRRMPEEKESDSLSGARFTRKGREAQIYVMRKIAQRLEDRGRLYAYRKSFTRALDRFRRLCESHYPDLSNECSELISRYGEPLYLRTARKLINGCRHVINDTHRFLSRVKNRMVSKNKSTDAPNDKNNIEIRYGLDTCRKVLAQAEKAAIVVPSRPDISVILPISNNRASIERSLRSVLEQTFENIEIITALNSTNDSLGKIKKQFGNSRIRYVTGDNLQNMNSFRNRGLMEVKGRFVAFLDPGDEWLPDKLSKQIERFQSSHDRIGLIYSGVEVKAEGGDSSIISPQVRGNGYRKLLQENVIGNCSSVMIRRTVIPSAGFFDDTLSEMAEHDYWLRIARYFEFDFVEEALVINHALPGQNNMAINNDAVNKKTDARTLFLKKHSPAMKREGVDRENFLKSENGQM